MRCGVYVCIKYIVGSVDCRRLFCTECDIGERTAAECDISDLCDTGTDADFLEAKAVVENFRTYLGDMIGYIKFFELRAVAEQKFRIYCD